MGRLRTSTKPFNGCIERDLALAKERIQVHNKPCAIMIVSPPGRGKTTLAVHLAEEYEGRQINYKDYIGNGFEDFNRVLASARRRPDQGVVIYDEGGDIDKKRALSDTNLKVRRILQLARGFKKLIIMCLQDYSGLDRSLLKLEVFYFMYYIPWRGGNYADYNAYSLAKMMQLLNKMNFLEKQYKLPQLAYGSVHPNYRGHFWNLSEKRASDLEVYSNEAKDSLLDIIAGLNDDFETLATIKTITGKSGEWIRQKLKEKGISALRKIKNKNVFAKGTAELLTK